MRVLELQPAARGLTLQALLVNTVQRLPRYQLLLREILKNTADGGGEGGSVESAQRASAPRSSSARRDAALSAALSPASLSLIHI